MTDIEIYVVEYYSGMWQPFITEDLEVVGEISREAEVYHGDHLFKVVKVTMKPTPANIAWLAHIAAKGRAIDLTKRVAKYKGWKTEKLAVKTTLEVQGDLS